MLKAVCNKTCYDNNQTHTDKTSQTSRLDHVHVLFILLLEQLYLTFTVLSTFFPKIMYLLLFAASRKSLTLTMPPVNGSEKQIVKHVTALK